MEIESAKAALEASAAFQPDGRFQVAIDHDPQELPNDYATPVHEPGIDFTGFMNAPPMNVNIMIVGNRGTPIIIIQPNISKANY